MYNLSVISPDKEQENRYSRGTHRRPNPAIPFFTESLFRPLGRQLPQVKTVVGLLPRGLAVGLTAVHGLRGQAPGKAVMALS